MKNSSLCPLFWQHHESEEVLRNEIAKMDEAGIGSFIIEPRPHPHYLEQEWWDDLAILIDEAKKRDMYVYFFDDGTYPSGKANGLIAKHYPATIKQYLAKHHVDAIGPMRGGSILVNDWLEEDEKFFAAVAVRRIDGLDLLDIDTAVDITDRLSCGALYWDIPEGEWRIFIFKLTNRGGEDYTKDYLNPLEPEGARAFISLTYEQHYRHFGAEFGKTVRGFFTDEPRFGNAAGYHYIIGKLPMVLPWSATLLDELNGSGLGDFRRLIPALFCEGGEKTADIRYAYMNAVSRRFNECFLGLVGGWCREHGVSLIGHVVEENGAHARLGYGTGHYFRAMEGLDMAGIDVVNNIYPGRTDGKYLTMFNDYDTTFNHWGLSKMASSCAQLDPNKHGTTLCEAFGAYGWSEGLKTMKWITDAMCVRGVNFIVPHAFSPRNYPDPDCPPHFYARGNNPQFIHFTKWSAYANRVCGLLSGGRHIAPVAVLYHAESEWGGSSEPFEAPLKQLMRAQIDATVVPTDMLADENVCMIEKGGFSINGKRFSALVIPACDYLAPKMETVLSKMNRCGVPVYFRNAFPKRCYLGETFAVLENMRLTPAEETASALIEAGLFDIHADEAQRDLAYCHYEKNGVDAYFFTNEALFKTIDTRITFRDSRSAVLYDAMEGKYFRAEQTVKDGCTAVSITLRPYESIFVLFGCNETTEAERPDYANEALNWREIDGEWSISVSEYGENHMKVFDKTDYTGLVNLALPDKMPAFSGTIRYETALTADRHDLALSLGEVYEAVRVYVNDQPIAEKICPPYDLTIPAEALKTGENALRIEVTNTLGKACHNNIFDRFWVQEPSGLIGPVRIAEI